MSVLRNRQIQIGIAVLALIMLGCTCGLPALRLSAPTAAPAVVTAPPVASAPPTVAAAGATPTAVPAIVPQENAGRAALAQEQVIIDIYKRVSPSVVYIEVQGASATEGGSGSGFVYDTQGHVMTNAHVVSAAEQIWVYFSDETAAQAQILGIDEDADLAVLQVDVPQELLVPAELGSSADLQGGQLAIAIGNPYGYERTLTVGFISALGRVLQQESGFSIAEVIQTDAAINPGNSGGPLLDSSGKVIGINSYYRPSNPLGGSIGIGFAVPVDEVKLVVPELISTGRYGHAWLGITGYEIRPDLVSALDLPVERGALVATVIDGSPAQQAGVVGGTRLVELPTYPEPIPAGGDIIVAIDDVQVGGMDDIITYLQNMTVGQQVVLTIVRGGRTMTLTVELAERPPR
jgi:S1-C subfamily serine protease